MKHKVLSLFNTLFNAKPLLWLFLAIPAWPLLCDFIKPDLYYPEMMYRTGLLATQLFVFTLCITPISQLLKKFKKARGLNRWLLTRRRNFGVASFAYAFIHTMLYLRETTDLDILWREMKTIEIGFGWLAIVFMLPIAFTSNDASMRKLGKHWKTLQRGVYLLAIAIFVHWLTLGLFIEQGIPLLQILLFAKAMQLGFRLLRNKRFNLFWFRKSNSLSED